MLLSRPIICNRKRFGKKISFNEFITIEKKGNKQEKLTTYRVENVSFCTLDGSSIQEEPTDR
jgi:hypothetical protein